MPVRALDQAVLLDLDVHEGSKIYMTIGGRQANQSSLVDRAWVALTHHLMILLRY